MEPDAAQRLKNELAAALPADPVVATKAMQRRLQQGGEAVVHGMGEPDRVLRRFAHAAGTFEGKDVRERGALRPGACPGCRTGGCRRPHVRMERQERCSRASSCVTSSRSRQGSRRRSDDSGRTARTPTRNAADDHRQRRFSFPAQPLLTSCRKRSTSTCFR
ncbi:hypothetical protein [Burkholderia sp. BE17]|uniref:hypothetical protein n=1 Tax=Burkholderia sp. BE17 TaxID=2656644 RepID=UPI0039EE72D7